jgi:hypothetical protein
MHVLGISSQVKGTVRTYEKFPIKLAKEENHLTIPMQSQTKQRANSHNEVYIK